VLSTILQSIKKWHEFPKKPLLLADSGYQGLASLHPKSWIPNKKPKNGMLSAFSRLWNRALATLRVSAENIFAKLKFHWKNSSRLKLG
jgi:hypothetical protein